MDTVYFLSAPLPQVDSLIASMHEVSFKCRIFRDLSALQNDARRDRLAFIVVADSTNKEVDRIFSALHDFPETANIPLTGLCTQNNYSSSL